MLRAFLMAMVFGLACQTGSAISVGGIWTSWSAWSDCSLTCGTSGVQFRRRACASAVGQPCFGWGEEYRNCPLVRYCPVEDPCETMKCEKCHLCQINSRDRPVCVPFRISQDCCLNGTQATGCREYACASARCDVAGARCTVNQCGGCHAEFYDENWQKRVCLPKEEPTTDSVVSCSEVKCGECESCRLDSHQKPVCIRVNSRPECCAKDVRLARCFAAPCEVTLCNITDAKCIPNYCGGCNAEFYNPDYTTRVCLATTPPSPTTPKPTMPTTTTPARSTTTAMPTTTATPITCADVKCATCHRCHVDSRMTPVCVAIRQRNECCPVGKRVVNCFADPCEVTKCGVADAKCIPNYCGGCNAEFYNGDYTTRVCLADAPTLTTTSPPTTTTPPLNATTPRAATSCAHLNCTSCHVCLINEEKLPVCVPIQQSFECCPKGNPLSSCKVNPCEVTKCSLAGSICVPNYCGGCTVEFYDRDYKTPVCQAI